MRAFPLFLLLAATGLALTPAAHHAAQDDCIVLDDFSAAKVGAFPAGWEVRKDEGKRVYQTGEEAGRRFLRAVSKGLGVQAARETPTWDLATHPVLVWSWRPREFPKGADERESATNDSALAVYMGVPHSRIRGPKAVKYIWSEKVPAGTRLSSNAGLTQVRVLRSGPPASRDAWVEERVNVRDDWKAAFKESDTPRAGGIAVLTDADDTSSTAAGDYATFRACRSR
ncbi:MAG TPA: DUF3047 domain-containing protein [Methylomirabilota bacterium]|nr:DUF3047 domain-containing protein [Methylomirabilota bacterium]